MTIKKQIENKLLLRLILLCSLIIVLISEFVFYFENGLQETVPLTRNNVGIVLIGLIEGLIFYLFGLTISSQKEKIRRLVIFAGILTMVIHAVATIYALIH